MDFQREFRSERVNRRSRVLFAGRYFANVVVYSAVKVACI
ncbi:hypothetical protein HMPREF3208_00051 [Gardnerella vaginalis]|uniref:Uncharacterized protein n=1 Tax=Gardnerella vaginalis TaxID=2702 RepID=A0A133P303_GARVA|nr:hypothetical protein HMPREF3208_00051 [Gardnerella vaginalis]